MQTSTVPTADRPGLVQRRPAEESVPALRAEALTKHYRSPWTLRVTRGLDGLDLEIQRGEIFGLLGPNGAGKTTTLKLVTGLLKPTRGRAWIFGQPIERHASRRRLGFLPEQPYFFDSLNGIEYLELVARLSGVGAGESTDRARSWLGRVGLGDRPRLRLRKYSKGMLQRLGLAASLVHDPELLILDEPMSGLDPFGRRDVRELILEQRARGTTVLFSSHILPDVEMLCDRVAVVMAGRLVRTATVAELVEESRHAVEIRCTNTPLIEIPARFKDVVTRFEHPEGTAFLLSDHGRVDEVVQWLHGCGARLRAVTPQRSTLEEFFLAAARKAEAARAGESAGLENVGHLEERQA